MGCPFGVHDRSELRGSADRSLSEAVGEHPAPRARACVELRGRFDQASEHDVLEHLVSKVPSPKRTCAARTVDHGTSVEVPTT